MSVEDDLSGYKHLSASKRMEISDVAQDPNITSIDEFVEKGMHLGWGDFELNFALNQRFPSEDIVNYNTLNESSGIHHGGIFAEYMTHLVSNNWGKETVDTITKNVEETYDRIIHNNAEIGKNEKAGYGLVVGRIQSGKTAHMLGLCMRALDRTLHKSGKEYNTVILLSGLLEDLRKQTFSRLKKAEIHQIIVLPEKSDFKEKNMAAKKELEDALLSVKPCILVVKKNHLVLEAIINYLKDENIAIQLDERRILIIDDECDHASIDSSHSEQESPTELDKITATNRAVRRLIRQCKSSKKVCWYIGYTATPYSNLLMHPEPEYLDEDGLGPSLFPRDMIHCLPKPDEHKDNEFFFNGNAKPYIEQFEIPCAGGGEERNHLRKLVILHVISRLLRKESGKESTPIMTHTTMVHTDTEVDEHLRVAEIVRTIKEEYHTMEDSELHKNMILCAKKYYPGHTSTLESIISKYNKSHYQKIQVLFTNTEVVVLNSDKPDDDQEYEYPKELNYTSEHEVSLIVVGGQKLSRGLTLEGLAISWFARTSKKPNYDTLLQMARWCGYRGAYCDYIRIFMNEETVGHFQLITEVERRLRTDLRKLTKYTNPLDEVQWIREYKGLSISGRLPKDLVPNPSESKSIPPELMLTHLPENFTNKNQEETQRDVFEAFEELEITFSGEGKIVHGEFDLFNADLAFIKPFLQSYFNAYGKSCESQKYLRQLLIEIEESESFGDWNLVIHKCSTGREIRGQKVSKLGFKNKGINILRYPKILPTVDFEHGNVSRQKPMLCIFLEDPSHNISGIPVYADNNIPVVMIGFFLPPNSISAAFIEMARPGVGISAGEEE